MTIVELVAKIETNGPLLITLNFVGVSEYFRAAFLMLDKGLASLPEEYLDKEVLSFRIKGFNEIDVDFCGDM